MAVSPRDIQITRDQVQRWIDEFNQSSEASRLQTPLEPFIRGKVAGLALPDAMVDTSGIDGFADETDVADMILADLESYST